MSVPAGYRSRPATLDDVDTVDRFFREVDQALFGSAESSRGWVEESWRSDWVDLPTMTLLVFSADGGVAATADLEAIDPAKEIGAWVHAGSIIERDDSGADRNQNPHGYINLVIAPTPSTVPPRPTTVP